MSLLLFDALDAGATGAAAIDITNDFVVSGTGETGFTGTGAIDITNDFVVLATVAAAFIPPLPGDAHIAVVKL